MAERVQLRAAKKRDHAYFIRLRTLIELRGEATHRISYPGEYQHGQTEAWKLRAATALAEILGEFHPLTEETDQLWNHKTLDDPGTQQQHWRKAEGILNAAIASYTFMNIKLQDSGIANTLDAELMARVDHVFRVEDWTAVASLAAAPAAHPPPAVTAARPATIAAGRC